MKKTLSMLLAGAMLATALTGCGGSASSSSDSQNSGSDSTASGTAFQIGGTFGALLLGALMDRYNPYRVLALSYGLRDCYLRQCCKERRADRC